MVVDEVLQIDDDLKRHLVLVDGLIAQDAYTSCQVSCCSWTLDDYYNAIKDDEVWNNVSPFLDAHEQLPGEEISRKAMVESNLRDGGLKLVDAAGNVIQTCDESQVVVTDKIPAISFVDPVWSKPEKWNQGGYDAIMVSKCTQHVRFVQVTRAHQHSFHIEYFYAWLELLSESSESFEVKTFKIFFVVEKDKLKSFELVTVTGAGLLQQFGWQRGKEAERVKLVGMQELYGLS
ncbi:unnamed protein product [Phytophthora lilii]|uniref:Unnamed protein product n=1 Tax=Phytophthora lilii TaxID=2077276 RepID=A0A9W6TU47_9STRA|nr:unnamed protein product [Phytophthora lilii]